MAEFIARDRLAARQLRSSDETLAVDVIKCRSAPAATSSGSGTHAWQPAQAQWRAQDPQPGEGTTAGQRGGALDAHREGAPEGARAAGDARSRAAAGRAGGAHRRAGRRVHAERRDDELRRRASGAGLGGRRPREARCACSSGPACSCRTTRPSSCSAPTARAARAAASVSTRTVVQAALATPRRRRSMLAGRRPSSACRSVAPTAGSTARAPGAAYVRRGSHDAPRHVSPIWPPRPRCSATSCRRSTSTATAWSRWTCPRSVSHPPWHARAPGGERQGHRVDGFGGRRRRRDRAHQ